MIDDGTGSSTRSEYGHLGWISTEEQDVVSDPLKCQRLIQETVISWRCRVTGA